MMGKGRIHIYYGNGKGKTTAAVGQVVRAAGHGLKVLVFQFMKDNSSGERAILEQLPNVTCLPGREMCIRDRYNRKYDKNPRGHLRRDV